MGKEENITIQLKGSQNGQPISPRNIDLHDINQYLQDIEQLIGREKKHQAQHPITISIESGSVLVIISAASLILSGLISDLQRIQGTKSFHGVSPSRRHVLQKWMRQRRLKGYEYRIWDQEKTIDANLSEWGSYAKQDGEHVRMEQHISGEVIQIGHEGDPCYLMRLPDRRIVTVQCDPETLANDKNRMYQNSHAIVSYDYDMLKKTEFNFKLVEWVDEYNTDYNHDALEQSILMAAEGLSDITDPITWTHELRGNDDA